MTDITHYRHQAGEESTTSTSLANITACQVAFTNLTAAGFAAGDSVFIIWSYSIGAASTTNKTNYNFGHGTTFAGRTDFLAVNGTVEANDASSYNGHQHGGWIEQHTLVDAEHFFFALSTDSGTARVANYSVTFIKVSDLAADDYRYNATSPGTSIGTTFSTEATVTLPSGGGDDWLVLTAADIDVASTTIGVEGQLNVSGVADVMMHRWEGEDTSEQLQPFLIYYLASAASSQVLNAQYQETASSSFVVDSARILAIRLNAFESHAGVTNTSTVSLSATPDTYVEDATISLSLATTGTVIVFGQTISDNIGTVDDPYLRLQEGGTDIYTNMGRASGHSRDQFDFIAIHGIASGSMTAGTKTIDMDVALDESTTSIDQVRRSLVAFSTNLAGGTDVNVSAGVDALVLTENAATVSLDIDISATTDALSITTYPATISLGVDVSATTDALSITTYQATISLDVGVSATTDSLAITTYPVTITYDVAVGAGIDALVLTEYVATVSLGVDVSATTDALAITTHPATITYDVNVGAGVDALVLTEYAATISSDANVAATTDALTLTEYPATITYDVEVFATTDALTLTPFAAIVVAGADVNVPATSQALVITEYSATVSLDIGVNAGVDALTLTTYQASVISTGQVVTTEEYSGGWAAINAYEAYQQRKKRRRRERELLLDSIPDDVDREIAAFMHPDPREQEIAELDRLVAETFRNDELNLAKEYSERAAKAYVRAATQHNFSALEAFEREMDKAMEEEEFLFLSMVMLQ
jgi:hypothetical protein